jgi:hypothetical protein
MTAHRIILALFLGLISAQSARAETACDNLSHMVESIALVRQIQNDPGGPAYRAQINRLNTLTAKISVADLIPADPAASRSEDRQAVSQYLSGLQTAVSSAMMGRDITARQSFETLVKPTLFNGLSSLDTHWDCSGNAPSAQIDLDSDIGPKTMSNALDGGAESDPNQQANPAESTANSGGLSNSIGSGATVGSGSGTGAAFGGEAVVTGNVMVYLMIFIAMILIGGFFYIQSRTARQKVRESRRALNASVDVRLNGEIYQMCLIDISMNGFKIGHSSQINDQDTISVAIGGTWYDGNIRWSNPHYAGVKFKRAINPETLSLALAVQTSNPPFGAGA